MNSWESPRRNLTKDRSSSSGLRLRQLPEYPQPTKRFAPNSKIANIFFAGDGGSRGSCERSCDNTIPSHLSCPATISPKRGTRTLAIYFQNKKSPPTRNWPISPKPIAPNKVRAIGGQSAPPSLKHCGERPGDQAGKTIGGQSAPPSLKHILAFILWCAFRRYRGAVRPPFIEAVVFCLPASQRLLYRGAVRPPFIEAAGR